MEAPVSPPDTSAKTLEVANRVVLGLVVVVAGLAATIVYLALHRPPAPWDASLLRDPDVRAAVVGELVRNAAQSYDSHPDPDVGRVLLAGLEDRAEGETRLSTNRYGMRERDYVLPKPEGVVRIVLLGDSMVYGLRAAAEDRMGVFLEQWLRERMPGTEVECLHLAIPSWNIRAEAAFLRRRLSELDPDLVLQIIVPNDLEDGSGVRGFGGQANFSPQLRHRGDSLILAGFPKSELGFERQGYLALGLDGESRTRYREAAEELRKLAEAVEAHGASYRVLVHFRALLPQARHFFHPELGERALYIGREFTREERFRTGGVDMHWNRAGHEQVASLLYGLILRDRLLPENMPPAWEESALLLREVTASGQKTASRGMQVDQILRRAGNPKLASALDFPPQTSDAAAQIHGGVDREGLVSPYASVLLARDASRDEDASIRILGEALARPEIDGARVRVFLDRFLLGEIVLKAGEPVEFQAKLPQALRARRFFSLRLEADDWVHTGEDLRRCVVFRLRRAESIG